MEYECKTCAVAVNPQYACMIDMQCPDCCARHILLAIETYGSFGPGGHAGRIKSALIEILLADARAEVAMHKMKVGDE